MILARYLVLMLLVGCAPKQVNTQDKTVPEAEAATPAVPGPPPKCVAEDGKQAECTDDRDCCPGYYCGRDPEGSHLKRYCLYSGAR